MDRPILAGDNWFSPVQYPLHVLTANEEPVGHEVTRLSNGRRSSLDYAGATTANDPWWAKATCDRVRAANYVALDKGHNLAGKQVKLEFSDDDFTSIQTAVDVVIPASAATGAIDDAFGVVTEEGAWLMRYPTRTAYAARLFIPAMGAGLTPRVVGLWVGLAYSPEHLYRPSDPDGDFFAVEETVTGTGAVGRALPWNRRQGQLRLKMSDEFEYELARYHLRRIFGAGAPTWLIHDEQQADRAVLAQRVGNSELLFPRESGSGWAHQQGAIPWQEVR